MNRWTVRRISLSNLRISKVTEEWRIGSSCGLRTFATCFAIDCESQSVINHCDRRFEFLRNQIKSHANERKSKPASLVEIETRPWLSIVINVIFAVQNIFLLAAYLLLEEHLNSNLNSNLNSVSEPQQLATQKLVCVLIVKSGFQLTSRTRRENPLRELVERIHRENPSRTRTLVEFKWVV